MSLIKDAQNQIGELFISGFEGTSLSDETRSFIKNKNIGGIILFAHNYETPEQVTSLNKDIQSCQNNFPIWISVDQEGGRVQRFTKPFTIIPTAEVIGNSDSPTAIFEISQMMAKELRSVGINLNFCPVADILTNSKNPVIGNRAFSSNPEIVAKSVTAMIRGHLTHGVQACVKHFPGHGDTLQDSHDELPKIDVSLETLESRELIPFTKAFKSRCSMVMTAHILNPKLDNQFPATLSEFTLKTILRKKLRYSKVIISDDMEMKAITHHYGELEAPILALKAGCDLLIYRSQKACEIAFEAIFKALEQGQLDPQIVLDAANRSLTLKKDFFNTKGEQPQIEPISNIGCAEHYAVIDKLNLS